MWIISQHGFYSIVRDRENATRFLIRSRVARDLQNLKSLAGLEAEVRSTPNSEYPYRLLAEEREMPRIMNSLGNTIDYPSFTARVSQRIEQACRSLIYSEVFDSLRAVFDPGTGTRSSAPRRSAEPALPRPPGAGEAGAAESTATGSLGQLSFSEPVPTAPVKRTRWLQEPGRELESGRRRS